MRQTAYNIKDADQNLKVITSVYIPIWLKNEIVLNRYNASKLLALGLEAEKGKYKAVIEELKQTIEQREEKIREIDTQRRALLRSKNEAV